MAPPYAGILALYERQKAALRQAVAHARQGTKHPVVVTLPAEGVPLDEIERQALILALERADYFQKGAAALLGISPRVLNYKLRTVLGIRRITVSEERG